MACRRIEHDGPAPSPARLEQQRLGDEVLVAARVLVTVVVPEICEAGDGSGVRSLDYAISIVRVRARERGEQSAGPNTRRWPTAMIETWVS
jgi:hypothetical protein